MTAWAEWARPAALELLPPLAGPATLAEPAVAPSLDNTDHSRSDWRNESPPRGDSRPDGQRLWRVPRRRKPRVIRPRAAWPDAPGDTFTDEASARNLDKLVSRRRRSAQLQERTAEALARLAERYQGPQADGRPHPGSWKGIAERWSVALADCGSHERVLRDPESGKLSIESDCCHSPACVRWQARRAREIRDRCRRILGILPAGRNEHPSPKRKGDRRHYSWKAIGVSPRYTGDLARDIATCVKLRAGVIRVLRRELGCDPSGWIAIECAPGDGRPHLHGLLYLPRDPDGQALKAIQRRMRAVTRDLPGGESFILKMNEVRVKGSDLPDKESGECATKAAWEAAILETIKYAVAPVGSSGYDISDEEIERNIECLLSLYKKHRVESYGLARKIPAAPPEHSDQDSETLPGKQRQVAAWIVRIGATVTIELPSSAPGLKQGGIGTTRNSDWQNLPGARGDPPRLTRN